MDWLKKLQEKYKAGKITKEQYDAKVKDLLDDGDLDQAEYDDALKYDPKADTGDKLIYSQADMDHMAINVGRRTLRQALKKAGIELDVENRGLVDEVVKLVKIGKESDGKGSTATEQEIAQLRKDAGKTKTLETQVKDLSLQNAVLQTAGRYQPHNPAHIVRAMGEYEDQLDFDDETGLPTARSVQAVISKLAKQEPYLFKTPNGDGGPGNQDDEHQQGGGFSGKTPGGSGGTGGNGGGNKAGEATVAEALARLGIKKQ
ncbi:SHOCT domain-containing protein [Paenibacillus sp. BK720]|uniref:SHOCT domain-containing protein n=1 Tax=Paenibacillus sp. BK720 TaxID=2587092 RepID=UPI00142178DB|nr:SHOCT domain-containing protein [Paenibacillus sp. BK720]NIK67927.1 hypothetical protein [Paenibacillus sp. BK720]